MKIRNGKSIATIYDAVSILKGLDIINGSLKQNYYAESALFVPDRFINPLILRPKIDISDPSGSIPNGDKVDELSRLEWFENGVKVNSNDDFKIEGANLTVFKNSEEPLEISYRAKWFDSRKKQVITIEDSVVVSCISLAQSDANVTMSLSKPQNWVHNPLKGERIYTINAYVSKDKVHESAVEWYYVDSNKKDKLIDSSCSFYVEGQYTNVLKVDSAYMDNVIIKAKNISNDKLKEVYWFFDKHGNPLTYAMPDKTIIEGKDIFNLPESPITSKLDYKINGLTLNNIVKGKFKDKIDLTTNARDRSINIPNLKLNDVFYFKLMGYGVIDTQILIRFNSMAHTVDKLQSSGTLFTQYLKCTDNSEKYIGFSKSTEDNTYISNVMIINLTQIFGAGNEPTKEWCDEHIQGYFEEIKSVQTPMRIKSVGENLFNPQVLLDVGFKHLGNGEYYKESVANTQKMKQIKLYKGINYTFHYKFLGVNEGNWRFQAYRDDSTYIYIYPNKTYELDGDEYISIGISFSRDGILHIKDISLTHNGKESKSTYIESNLYINNQLELKNVGNISDYIENGKLYKNISDNGEILEKTEVVNLSTSGQIVNKPNGTIFIEPVTLVEQQYNDGLQVDLPIKTLESIKVGKEYLDVSKAVVKDNLITHPELENGDFVSIEYIYDDNPIYGTNSIGYLSLEEILDDLWLDNVYTYKITNGEWELVKVTDIEDYEEWLKTEKTSPHTLAPDGVIFGEYKADTKFLRQFPSSLYVDIIAPTRLKQGITQIKARALVGTADGVIENPSKYFDISWYKKSNKAGASDVIIGEGEELVIDVADVDRIGIEVESKAIKK